MNIKINICWTATNFTSANNRQILPFGVFPVQHQIIPPKINLLIANCSRELSITSTNQSPWQLYEQPFGLNKFKMHNIFIHHLRPIFQHTRIPRWIIFKFNLLKILLWYRIKQWIILNPSLYQIIFQQIFKNRIFL